ncbi:hypothetical protein UT4_01080 [Ferrigenium sp. UT4]
MSPLQLLDVRGLPPPEPFMQIMAALAGLPPHGSLRVLIHREPFPLYEVLREQGYRWQTLPQAAGEFEILIGRAA